VCIYIYNTVMLKCTWVHCMHEVHRPPRPQPRGVFFTPGGATEPRRARGGRVVTARVHPLPRRPVRHDTTCCVPQAPRAVKDALRMFFRGSWPVHVRAQQQREKEERKRARLGCLDCQAMCNSRHLIGFGPALTNNY
jgi:hypothetical protein